MKGSEAKFVAYMQGADKRFIIPAYQRNYDWKTENCKQLYDDLVKVIKNNRSSHFFGSLVSVHNDGAYNEFLVIDGQQRLTTISLLLLAMYNLMKSGAVIPVQANLADKIYKTYLIDEWQEDVTTRIKLKPVKNDRMAFERLFEDGEEHIPESNLTVNYNYFHSRIQREEITIDELYAAITKLEIINITLHQDDNPQLIFESLNSTGLALSEGDKIRNLILMGLSTIHQNEFYEKYWNKIEVCTKYDVSLFIRDYLSVKQLEIAALSKIFVTFKTYVEEAQVETEPLLQDLLRYAKWYEILLKGKTANKALNASIYRLNRLETTVTRPFFLEILRMWDENKITLDEVSSIFTFTESYLFRRTICDLPTNALNKIFLTLHKEILRYDGLEDDYFEKFKFALLSKAERGRFPDNTEFGQAFASRQVYLMNSKNKIYLLERLENHGTVEDKDIYRHFDDGDYSIEHIMPQHLTPTWVKSLGEDYENIQELWLHRIANLTLTGYNSKYSNSDFEEKRDTANGFRESGLRMNTWIAQQTKWTLTEIEERSEMLSAKALGIWAMPVTNYQPAEKQMYSCSLEDDVNLGGRVLARYSYKNTEQPVDSWIDMFERVVKALHSEDETILTVIAHSNDAENELSQFVSSDPQKLRSALQISDGIFVERNTSTNSKISMLRKFFKAFNVSTEDLIFYLREASQVESDDEPGSRFERRRRYWAFALPYIHTAHEDDSSFSNVNPSKQNWISGFMGISGVSINCVANENESRVEFYIGNASKEKNKAWFDVLYSHKAEIEAALGIPLEWVRSEDTKASWALYRLPDVSILNETDWTMMAKFHAEWSKKFYDVMAPYIKSKVESL